MTVGRWDASFVDRLALVVRIPEDVRRQGDAIERAVEDAEEALVEAQKCYNLHLRAMGDWLREALDSAPGKPGERCDECGHDAHGALRCPATRMVVFPGEDPGCPCDGAAAA